MTSTVVDAALCLLLVSAGAVTLVTVPDAGGVETASGDAAAADARRADTLATTLTAATASVNYTLAPGARRASGTPVAFPATEGPQFERTSRGTLASLVAEATVAGVRVRGTRLDRTGDDFRQSVRARVLETVGTNVQVVAVWSPTRTTDIGAKFVVGPDPPAGRSVHAAVVTAGSGYSAVRERAVSAGRTAEADADQESDGHARLARRVAATVVVGLLPPEETRFALDGDYPVTALTRHRYHRLARLLGVDLGGSVTADPGRTNVTRATELLVEGLTDRFVTSFERSGATTGTIESQMAVDRVRITVRTWRVA